MANPALTLTTRLQAALAAAFGAEYRTADPVLRRSDRADYQANAAMSLAKALGKSPRDIATSIVDHLDTTDVIDSVEIAGPGFLNINLLNTFIDTEVIDTASDATLRITKTDKPERIVMDYSAPNVAKEMHIGHLRSTIIGDSLVRVFEALGHTVIRQNHIGDWGTPFGMLIEHLIDLGADANPQGFSVNDFDQFYKEARQKFDSDSVFADRARERVVKLQSGEPETIKLWEFLVDLSKEHFNEVYKKLEVLLTDDDLYGESKYNDDLPEVARELEERGIAIVDDGALCAFPPGFTNREGKPFPVIVRKSGGGYGYASTDLALVRYRVRTLHANRSYHVVGSPQKQHFETTWAVARMAGWTENTLFEHVPFGSVLDKEGKAYKSRSGQSNKLVDLLDEAVLRAAASIAERNPNLSGDDADATARMIGIGAIKYADLANDRIKDYTFDFDRMLAFEGNTAPYLQYAHARIYSIFRKAELSPTSVDYSAVHITNDAERELALQLLNLGAVVNEVAEFMQPHRLCTYLFDVASTFTSFYEKCSVLNAESEALKLSRLALCMLTARTLETGLSLLGISAPQQM